ncbi:unnamed protein product [Polarella glacialis]|uniref:Fe2OG dioxygenase domain-containing protein n=2 Tax=Polarella glacialis TaxID=89957 RepID=A0A813FLY8_POLGL|nr:unnamed protein product [Polarella glacialis]
MTRDVGYGIFAAVATCRSWTGIVSAEELEDAAKGLACIQNARVVKWYPCMDVCPFDQCWFQEYLRGPAKKNAAPLRANRLPSLGIVTTFRGAPNLESWVRYHLKVGIKAFYLYADSAADAEAARRLADTLGPEGAYMRIVEVDDALRQEWESLVGWSRYGPRLKEVGSAVMARQCLNAEHAMIVAGAALDMEQEGEGAEGPVCEWLLHCDADELVCMNVPEEGADDDGQGRSTRSLQDFLAEAELMGVAAIVLANHEVALEEGDDALRDIADPFLECTLFKVNDRINADLNVPTPADDGGKPGGGDESLFIQYSNGKSMARVGRGARPHGVHKWLLPGGSASGVMVADARELCLLHYPDCGYSSFVEKYKTLGNFGDEWFGQNQMPFRLRARDAAKAGPEALEGLYRKEVIVGDEARVRTLIDRGDCVRINKARHVLQHTIAVSTSNLPNACKERWRFEVELVPTNGDESDDDAQDDCEGKDVATIARDPPWCSAVFDELCCKSASEELVSLGDVKFVGWRTEPFFFGSVKMVVIVVVTGKSGSDSAAQALVSVCLSVSDKVQSASIIAQRQIPDKASDDAFDTCRRLFQTTADFMNLGILKASDVATFLEQGFLVLDNVFDAAVSANVARLAAASLAADKVCSERPENGSTSGSTTTPTTTTTELSQKQGLPWRWPEQTARGDCVCWIDNAFAEDIPATLFSFPPPVVGAQDAAVDDAKSACSSASLAADLKSVLSQLAALQLDLVQCAADGRLLGDREVQLAWYPANGAAYAKHCDALPDDGSKGASGLQRKVTAICYCNPSWTEASGGCLRITRQDRQGGGTVDVEPVAGRLVLFMSRCVQHEVRPSFADRYALTAWYW